MDRDWTASFSIRFRNGTCIIILDKMYNIANSSWHFGSYGSIWTGPSPKKYYMDLRSFGHMTHSDINYLLYVDIVNADEKENILKQTIMYSCFSDLIRLSKYKNCNVHLICITRFNWFGLMLALKKIFPSNEV
jgi:hypothetical protein